RKLLKGKRIVIVEDSIIRGTTARTRVRALKEIGVKEIHMRVSCPPHRFACHYGIDFSTRGELVAAEKSVEQIRDYLGLDSLHYLSLEGLLNSTGESDPPNRFCYACFNGCYPVSFDEDLSKDCLER
ncbi:MAG: amidophosphoribosyltransferase, partial [Thermodesulfobacteriota bacterium]